MAGVRDATQFGARCEQWHIWNDYIFLDPGPSEDCLFLNVYVPATAKSSAHLPVMFWIHGGGYAAGSGSEPRYTNSVLPTMGVILVTINYRLNALASWPPTISPRKTAAQPATTDSWTWWPIS